LRIITSSYYSVVVHHSSNHNRHRFGIIISHNATFPACENTVRMKYIAIATALTLAAGAAAYSVQQVGGRRAFLQTAATVTASTVVSTPGVAHSVAADEPYADFQTTESGLRYKVTKEGDGAIPSPGQTVKAHYTGWLDDFNSIKKFDSSRDRGRPFSFKVGAGQVIRGWDEVSGWGIRAEPHSSHGGAFLKVRQSPHVYRRSQIIFLLKFQIFVCMYHHLLCRPSDP